MDTKTYKVRGKFKMGEEMQPFTKEVRALSKKKSMKKFILNLVEDMEYHGVK